MTTDKARARQLWNAFRITPAEWETVHTHQRGVCFVCGLPQADTKTGKKRLASDHDHETGEFRGLLCSRCNPLLGKLENAFRRYGLHKIPDMTLAKALMGLQGYLAAPPVRAALGRTVIGYPGRIGTAAHRKWVRDTDPNAKPRRRRKRIKKGYANSGLVDTPTTAGSINGR